MPDSSATEVYRAARDQLLALRGDHVRAAAEFRWPRFDGPFNWAVDWFDAYARDNDRTGLHLVEEDGRAARYSFAELARRSDQVANWLRGQGVGSGDRVVLMLGNQVELWESMLAVQKLGAVIMPTTTALGPADLVDRIERGGARHVVANAADTAKFEGVPGDYTRIAVGDAATGWLAYTDATGADDAPPGHPGTGPDTPLLLYFTSGTTSRPKLVEHTQVSYPVGHLSTMYWLGLQPGDVHLNISSPGWAKHAWSCFFAPWIAEATVYLYNYSRFDPAALLERIRADGITSFCAPPTVWRMLIKADLSGGPGAIREAVAAGEPLNPEVIEQVKAKWGLTIRDGYGQTETTASVGNTPGSLVKPGSMGRPLPGVPVVLVDPLTGEVGDEGEICLDLSGGPLSLMTGYQGDPERHAEAMAGGHYHTGDVATRDEEGYISYVGRTDDVFKASDYKISPFELESVLIEHPAVTEALDHCLDGLTEEQARRSLVSSRTTLLGLVKHATFVEKVWFDEAVTCRSRAEIGIAATPDESFVLDEQDTVESVRRAHRAACEASRRATSALDLDDLVRGNRRGPLPLRWVYLHVLRELAQHCGHADILREQLLAA